MSEIKIVWSENKDLVSEIIRMLDECGGKYCGSHEQIIKRLGLDCTPSRLTARLKKRKPELAQHGITYRSSRKIGGIVLERVECEK